MKDLIVLVADGDMDQLVTALLKRISAVEDNVRSFNFDVQRHPLKDPGVCNNSVDFLRLFINSYKYVLVMCDYEGCGKDRQKNHFTREQVEIKIETELSNNGWPSNNCAIVVDPEIENWIWVHPTHMQRAIGWNRTETITTWAISSGWLQPGFCKPARPKEALEAALYLVKTPRSSSIYRKIAENASYGRCIDPAFLKFVNIIRSWFKLDS